MNIEQTKNEVEDVESVLLYDTEEKGKVADKEPEIETFNLVHLSDEALSKVLPEFDFDNAPINPADFASSLVETCKKYNGFGLSANQCGFEYRVFVMGVGDEYVAYFNPKLIAIHEEDGLVHMPEACLSFPMLTLNITRPAKIDVEYQDFNGEKRTKTFSGMTARCFLHELDHMNGIVYTNRVKPLALKFGLKKIEKKRAKFFKQMKKFNMVPKNAPTTDKPKNAAMQLMASFKNNGNKETNT